MRLPIIPFLVAAMLLAAAVYIFTSTGSRRRALDAPNITRVADINGVETEVAVALDGDRCAVIVSNDLWLLKLSTGEQLRLTETPDAEFFPNWTPDGKRITFTRGVDTIVFNPETGTEQTFKQNATWLSWSPTGRVAFVRDRALWLADPNGRNEKQIVAASDNPDLGIRTPRFAPDSIQLGFVKSVLNLRGEIWLVNALDGQTRPLVADRPVENPSDLGWIMDGTHLVYLTNRAGAYSLWQVDFGESQILPLTQVLVGAPLARLGIGISKDRIVLPRHLLDSNIVTSDGKPIAQTDNVEFEPAVSPDGKTVAYTLEKENAFEVWTASIDGSNATFRAVGREPRWSPNGFEIVYTQTDLSGDEDIWKIDIRNANAERVTDADEIDVAADWSTDGRTIAFSSARGGALSVWTIPASGGKRLRLNHGGYAPRFSRDNRSIVYWTQNALWTMDPNGENRRRVFDGLFQPTVALWAGKEPAFFMDNAIRSTKQTLFSIPGRMIWPRFDMLPDGRWVVAPIDIHETALWAVDLTYKEN